MTARLYVIPLSNPAGAAAAMTAYKRLPHRLITLPPGFHPWLVRLAGFSGETVPALDLGDRLVQGTRAIARVLDELVPERPLFPSGRDARRAVEEAERWGHDELQPVPRRIFRWAMVNDPQLAVWFAREIVGAPAPRLGAVVGRLLAGRLAAVSGADEAAVSADVRNLPALLDHVDELLAAGTLGGAEPNSADFQILASVRVMLEYASLAHEAEGRPCAAAARGLYPQWGRPIPPTLLPVS